jgi:prevent-host-death family protein
VRELRQHASRYLARVAAGETLEVTDRGRPVARLGPVPVDSWDQMIADGRIIPASDPDAFLDITPKHYPGPSASEVLAAMREDER